MASPRQRTTEQEFKAALAEWLQSGPPAELGELGEQLQVELATPGEWAAAEHQPPDLQPPSDD